MKRNMCLLVTILFLLSCCLLNASAECEYHEMGSWYYYDQYISEPEIRHTICYQVVKEFFRDCQNCNYFEVRQVVDDYLHEWVPIANNEEICSTCGMRQYHVRMIRR